MIYFIMSFFILDYLTLQISAFFCVIHPPSTTVAYWHLLFSSFFYAQPIWTNKIHHIPHDLTYYPEPSCFPNAATKKSKENTYSNNQNPIARFTNYPM